MYRCALLFSPKPRLGERNSHIPIPETLPEKVSDYDQTLEGFVTGGTQDFVFPECRMLLRDIV